MDTGTIRKLINRPAETPGDKPSQFGFIRPEHGQATPEDDLFFLPSTLQRTTVSWDELHEGERVEFNAINHPKGRRAVDVRVLRGNM